MFRHIDLLAIALVLAGFGLFAQARKTVVFELQSVRWINFSHQALTPVFVEPDVPHLCLTQD